MFLILKITVQYCCLIIVSIYYQYGINMISSGNQLKCVNLKGKEKKRTMLEYKFSLVVYGDLKSISVEYLQIPSFAFLNTSTLIYI